VIESAYRAKAKVAQEAPNRVVFLVNCFDELRQKVPGEITSLAGNGGNP
jgi:hypothetical protein